MIFVSYREAFWREYRYSGYSKEQHLGSFPLTPNGLLKAFRAAQERFDALVAAGVECRWQYFVVAHYAGREVCCAAGDLPRLDLVSARTWFQRTLPDLLLRKRVKGSSFAPRRSGGL